MNPDVIFVVYFNLSNKEFVHTLLQNPVYNSLAAAHDRKIYPIYLELMYSSGVRTGEGLEILAKGMYGL